MLIHSQRLGRGLRYKRSIAVVRAGMILILLSILGCCPRVSMVDVGPLKPLQPIDCIVSAHRGTPYRSGDGLRPYPDNSLVALQASIALGVPLVEVDVRLSDDGELFLFHDGSLSHANSFASRHLYGTPIGKLSREERSGVSLDETRSESIPTLDDALSLIARSGTTLQIDLKGESDTLAFLVVERVAQRGLLSHVVLQMRSPARAARIKEQYPRVRLLVRCQTREQLDEALKVGVELVELERWVSSEAIQLAHSHRTKVLLNLSTSRLDEPATWNYLRSRGVDAIMSDRAREHVCRQ